MNHYTKILLIVFFLSSCSFLDKKKYDSFSLNKNFFLLNEIDFKKNILNKNFIGMTRKQIVYIFGMPIIKDSFHDVYHYHFYKNKNANFIQKEMLNFYFKNNKVSNFNIK
ncbi:outer membrane protein assembly factor BamE [Buchnera aphidicola]|uniref:Outer membrane protein assembly factor BamE n=1 Tax=Buchnera aphidicola (Artemisaphis artemisicola) TaxID=1241836 RepID=A0A4D6XLU9_9GAMM|nr:outer membrane protein assembly factor BamE [Buchnera aphidicola]QCI15878.1 outer membrane protein assembly factor BamE [Buchnera aphidicola (Artemisaphis artemisicola)]